MSQFDQQWQRLTALARQAPADRDIAVPAGFATRVAARAAATPAAGPWSTLERFALRGFLAAAACSVAAAAFNYLGATPDLPEDVGLDETMSVWLDLS
jgi:hypothetical protein